MFSKQNVSQFIIGTMRLGDWGSKLSSKEYEEFIEGCLDLDLIDFDHADIYGHYTTETEFGNILKKRPELRKRMRITTKCGIKLISDNRPEHTIKSYDLTEKHIRDSVEISLRELGTDYLDVLLLHRPDYLFDPKKIAAVFAELEKEGKVLSFGVSNFSASQFDLLNNFTPLVTNQIEISLLHRNAFEDGILDQCQKLDIVPCAWSPLGGGSLFKDTKDTLILRIQKVLNKLSKKYSLGQDQILYLWLKKHPAGIIPVLGTSKIERIGSAKKALESNLTHEEWYMLWEAALGKEID